MTTPDEKAREAAARALAELAPGEAWPTNEELGGGPAGTRDDEYRDSTQERANEVIDAYLAALSPLPDEQLDEIEKRVAIANAPTDIDFGPTADQFRTLWELAGEDVPILLSEVRRLRALSSHPDEETAALADSRYDYGIAGSRSFGSVVHPITRDKPILDGWGIPVGATHRQRVDTFEWEQIAPVPADREGTT